MRLGIAHHFGWAVAVTATADHRVVDRRRIELIEPGTPAAPIHHDGKDLDDTTAAALVAQVRASATRATAASLGQLVADLGDRGVPGAIEWMSIRRWPPDFPTDIAVQRRVPYEARADSVMYLQVLAADARRRGWAVHLFDARSVESEAAGVLGDRAEEVLHGPRAALGPPWTKDHRVALAATVLAG
jgi:hypothetical protein